MSTSPLPGNGPIDTPTSGIDKLLADLSFHVDEIRMSRDRLSGLLDAFVALASDLELSSVLRHIVEVARMLLNARYAALGVLAPAGEELSEFVYDGIDPDLAARIGRLPRGGGILGQLITEPKPLRLDVLSDHPDSCGFPPDHPPMTSFLGVPLVIRGRVFGNLYLTDKQTQASFTEDDEDLAVALAAAAGVAIDNARLYERAVRQQQWLEASTEVTARMLEGAASHEVLSLIADHAFVLAGADEVGVRLPDAKGDGLVLAAGAGARSAGAIGEHLPLHQTVLGEVFSTGSTITVSDLGRDAPHDALVATRGVGPLVAIALSVDGRVIGTLSISRYRGRPPFDPDDLGMVESFATQAALVIAFAEARAGRERLLLFDDRDRIARDLHDLVIQRLFAAGLALQAVTSLLPQGEAINRVGSVVNELDDTIRELRTTIFALQHDTATGPEGTRSRLVEVVNRSADTLGFAPRLRISGEIDTRVDGDCGEQLVAALTEALANVVRHANATHVDVLVDVSDRLVLTVADDGVGYPAGDGRRSGLGNLAERAGSMSGELELGVSEMGGALLRWCIPLGPSRDR